MDQKWLIRFRMCPLQASYASAVSHGVASLGFTPPPPPGPPPATPPRDGSCSFMVDGGSQPPPPPPPHYPPIPPMPGFDGSPKRSGFLGENPTENLRTCELPRLVSDSTPLQFGDWWNMIDSHMGDLSYSSNVWWSMVKGSVERCYKEWLTCEPVARLRLRPQLDPTAHHWPRTERRALAMLLQAIPETIRDDVVASRKLTVDQVLFKLLITFQPGGASEKTRVASSHHGWGLW